MGRTMATTPTAPRGIELRKGADSETIRVKFMYRGVECRETLKLSHTRANINYADRLRGEILNAIERGTFQYADYFPESKRARQFGGTGPVRVTLGELIRDQIAIAGRTLSPSTVRGYQQVYDSHLKDQWDKTLLTDLKAPALRAWIGTLDCKIKTIRNILTPLRNALEQAVNDDLIEYNPLDRVKLDKILPREQRKSIFAADPFDIAEITAILAACADDQERNLWRFAFATGMRTSEFIALEWSSVDWVHNRVSMDRVKVEGITKDDAKTDAGHRQIDLRQGAFDSLKAQQQHTALAGGAVFHDARSGEPWTNDGVLKQRWMRILRKAGVRYRNPYQTRHTFASTLLSAGLNPLYVAKQMGHRDTEMINRHYGRWIEQGNDEATRQQSAEFFAQVAPGAKILKIA